MQAATTTERPREHTGGVIGVTVGLFVLVGIALSLFRPQGGTIDGAARVAELFGGGAPPFGLELQEAAELPSGDVLVRLARSAEGAGPEELVAVAYRSPSDVVRLFDPGGDAEAASRRLDEWTRDPSFAWHTMRRRAEIAWGEWRADYQVERAFEEGGVWRESARVNLSRPKRPLVLFAQWPAGTEVVEAELKELLRAVDVAREIEGAREG
jgi:hypothetical protein